VVKTRSRGAPLPVLAVVFALEMKGVLLDLGIAERLQYPAPVGAQEVVGHVRVEVEVVGVIQKVSVIKISVFLEVPRANLHAGLNFVHAKKLSL
jgi:hypothetical protein